MTGLEMGLLRRRLRRCGFRVYRFHYRSLREGVPAAAHALRRFLDRLPEPTVHFVAHSLGGLVVRRLLHEAPMSRVGRVVTLGTPHVGCSVAARLGHARWGRRLLGAGYSEGLDGRAPPWTRAHPLGSIAGTRPVGIGRLLADLPRPHDGTVAVAETRLPGADHWTVHTSHTGLLLSGEVARQTCRYLNSGAFSAD
ncbi:alpha/beta fold hydrolase [Ectothiorhodospiraceae bacterium 2226]|nr:alpha/beta fold hydrolase [Ectothiorhodospiraceae bacterium 2226]